MNAIGLTILIIICALLLIQTAASIVGFYLFVVTRNQTRQTESLLQKATAILDMAGTHGKMSDQSRRVTQRELGEIKEVAKTVATTASERLEGVAAEVTEIKRHLQGDSGTSLVEPHHPKYRQMLEEKQRS